MKKRVISILLVLCLTLSFTVVASATTIDKTISKDNIICKYTQGNHNGIITYDVINGEKVICDYLDGKMVQKNEIYPSDKTLVHVTAYSNNNSNYQLKTSDSTVTSKFRTTDIIKVSENDTNGLNNAGNNPQMELNSSNYGPMFALVNYSWQNSSSLQTGRYTAYFYYSASRTYNSTYTTNNYSGSVVNLITAIIGALIVPKSVVIAILVSYGINTAGSAIVDGFSAHLSCNRNDYVVTAQDSHNTSLTSQGKGSCYIINDPTSGLNNQRYYDGFAPQQWRESWYAPEMIYGLGRGNIYDLEYDNLGIFD